MGLSHEENVAARCFHNVFPIVYVNLKCALRLLTVPYFSARSWMSIVELIKIPLVAARRNKRSTSTISRKNRGL